MLGVGGEESITDAIYEDNDPFFRFTKQATIFKVTFSSFESAEPQRTHSLFQRGGMVRCPRSGVAGEERSSGPEESLEIVDNT